jgi:glutaconate CoA-transferase subunit B
MKFNDKTKAMYLSEYYPGITLDQISENTGFEMDLSMATEAIPPTDEELMILRNEVDPQRLILD